MVIYNIRMYCGNKYYFVAYFKVYAYYSSE